MNTASTRLILDGADDSTMIMIGGTGLSCDRADEPAAIWWREEAHTEHSEVVFRSVSKEEEILDRGVVDHTNFAVNGKGETVCVWCAELEPGAIYVRARGPQTKGVTQTVAGPGAFRPTGAISDDGETLIAWSRIEGSHQLLEMQFGSGDATTLTKGGWASRPFATALNGGGFILIWDELAPEGGSVQGAVIREGRVVRSFAVFERTNPGVRYIYASCAETDDGVLVTAVRVEDAMSPEGVVDQYHTIAAAMIDPDAGTVDELPDVARLDHGLLADTEQRTNVWGYLGRRLYPRVLPSGRVWWERKLRHDGFTVTENAIGVLCSAQLEGGTWSEEMEIHRGGHLYEVDESADGTLWLLHRPVVQDVTHRLVLESIDPATILPVREPWLTPQTYQRVSLVRERNERARTQHDGNELSLYFGDSHVHSAISFDPEGEPDELIHYARDLAGIDYVALTENDSLYTAWLRRFDRIHSAQMSGAWSEPDRFAAIDGFEYTRPDLPDSHRNHRSVLVRGKPGSMFRWDDPLETPDGESNSDHRNVDALASASERIDGLLVAHHANWMMSDSEQEAGIEAVSSWDSYFHNAEAIRAEWNRGRRLALIGGSDGHRRNAGLGGAITGVWATELTPQGILDGIVRRRTFASQGTRPTIEFRLIDDSGTSLFVGDYGRLQGGITASIRVNVEQGFDDRIALIELLHRERTLMSWSASETEHSQTRFSADYTLQGFDSIAANQTLKLPDPKYLYLRIRHEGPEHQFPSNVAPARGPWAWTTPIWWHG